MAKDKTTTKVTRIKATETTAEKPQKQAKPAKKAATVVKPAHSKSESAKKPVEADKTKVDLKKGSAKKKNIFARLIDYFKGAWFELRQVRWPDRRATWGMTGALLIFTGIFVTFILLVDVVFRYLFELIIG